jgi:coenzyme F420-reducing hydrogenase gamma subunit
VQVAQGTPCLGPVTHAGCGALCPTYQRGCYGCYGPKETPNTQSLSAWFHNRLGVSESELLRLFRTFNAWAEAFRVESKTHEH